MGVRRGEGKITRGRHEDAGGHAAERGTYGDEQEAKGQHRHGVISGSSDAMRSSFGLPGPL